MQSITYAVFPNSKAEIQSGNARGATKSESAIVRVAVYKTIIPIRYFECSSFRGAAVTSRPDIDDSDHLD